MASRRDIGDPRQHRFCVERLVSEADQRGLSAIMAEGLGFLMREFNLSIPNAAVSCMRAAASWTERAEMRLLADPPKEARISHLLLAIQGFRRRNARDVGRSIARILPAFLKDRAGVSQITPALAYAAQVILGRPDWLRRILGRDRYRLLPETDHLPKVGDTLQLGGSQVEKGPLISGWSNPEPKGRWTLGHEATVAWCVRGQDQDLTVLIDGIPALHEKAPPKRIDLWANDRRIASWRFQDGAPLLSARVLVPRGLIRNRDVLMLTFLNRRPAYPVAKGLYLSSLTLKAARE